MPAPSKRDVTPRIRGKRRFRDRCPGLGSPHGGHRRQQQRAAHRSTGVSRHYEIGGGTVKALDEVDLRGPRRRVRRHPRRPPGSGKTTLLNVIGALDTPTAGTHDDRRPRDHRGVAPASCSRCAATRSASSSRASTSSPALTALENVRFGADVAGRDDARRAAADVLAQVGLGEARQSLPARALRRRAAARRDRPGPGRREPDRPRRRADRRARLHDRRADPRAPPRRHPHTSGTAVLVVTHNREIARVADRIVELSSGRILSDEPNEPAGDEATCAGEPVTRGPRFWLRWSWRDLRGRWPLVLAIGLLLAGGIGLAAGLSSMRDWRIASNDASYANPERPRPPRRSRGRLLRTRRRPRARGAADPGRRSDRGSRRAAHRPDPDRRLSRSRQAGHHARSDHRRRDGARPRRRRGRRDRPGGRLDRGPRRHRPRSGRRARDRRPRPAVRRRERDLSARPDHRRRGRDRRRRRPRQLAGDLRRDRPGRQLQQRGRIRDPVRPARRRPAAQRAPRRGQRPRADAAAGRRRGPDRRRARAPDRSRPPRPRGLRHHHGRPRRATDPLRRRRQRPTALRRFRLPDPRRRRVRRLQPDQSDDRSTAARDRDRHGAGRRARAAGDPPAPARPADRDRRTRPRCPRRPRGQCLAAGPAHRPATAPVRRHRRPDRPVRGSRRDRFRDPAARGGMAGLPRPSRSPDRGDPRRLPVLPRRWAGAAPSPGAAPRRKPRADAAPERGAGATADAAHRARQRGGHLRRRLDVGDARLLRGDRRSERRRGDADGAGPARDHARRLRPRRHAGATPPRLLADRRRDRLAADDPRFAPCPRRRGDRRRRRHDPSRSAALGSPRGERDAAAGTRRGVDRGERRRGPRRRARQPPHAGSPEADRTRPFHARPRPR